MVMEESNPPKKRRRLGPGRPPWVPTPEALKEVENLAARGLSLERIADALGIDIRTLYRKKGALHVFSDAIKKGRAVGEANMADTVFQAGRNGNVMAATFFLKCRAGWS